MTNQFAPTPIPNLRPHIIHKCRCEARRRNAQRSDAARGGAVRGGDPQYLDRSFSPREKPHHIFHRWGLVIVLDQFSGQFLPIATICQTFDALVNETLGGIS